MVVRANRAEEGIGGHISTYASVATLFEIGFNHFFRGPEHPDGADMIYFQAVSYTHPTLPTSDLGATSGVAGTFKKNNNTY